MMGARETIALGLAFTCLAIMTALALRTVIDAIAPH